MPNKTVANAICPLGLCPGDGRRVYYALITRNPHGTNRQYVSKEQAERLRGKLDPQCQEIHEGIGPCRCGDL